jgi:hypothetical protein
METRIDSFNEKYFSMCKSCIKGKQHKAIFPKMPTTRATNISKLFHSDICGPPNPSTHCRNQYFITFIDDKFKNIMIYLWKHKYETFANFKCYKVDVKNQTNEQMKILKSNHGQSISLMNL